MPDFSHLNAIEYRLHRERARLAAATTPTEIAARTVWVAQAEKERANERAFLGLPPETETGPAISDADLLTELGL